MPPKFDSDSKATDKVLSLLSMLLFNRKEFSLTELAESLQCSKQTVLRLVDEVGSSGVIQIEIISRNRQNFYKAILPKRTNISFTQDEVKQLLFCRDFFQTMLPEKHKKILTSAAGKANLLSKEPCSSENLGYSRLKGILTTPPLKKY